MVELEFVGIAGDFDAVAVRIEKAHRAVARHHQSLRSADHRNLAPLQDWIELVNDFVLVDVEAEVMQLGHAIAAHKLGTLG